MFRPFLLSAALVALAAPLSARGGEGGTLYSGGRIILNDGREGVAEALFERDGRIVAVGALEDLEARADARGARRIDLRGSVVVPGLQDAHVRVAALGATEEGLDLRGAATYSEVIALVAARARVTPEGTWVVGRGWDQNLWPDGGFPHHLLLSNATPKHPVYLERVDGHAALVNHAALKLARLDGLQDPPPKIAGGRVIVDEQQHASGMLLDRAMDVCASLLPPPTHAERVSRLLKAQDKLLSVGLTAVHDMGVSRADIELYQELRERGVLKLRIVAYLAGNGDWKDATLAGLPIAPDADDLFCVRGVQLELDGSLGTRGAALLEDYADASGERGLMLLTPEQFVQRASDIARAGLQPAVHAIGDRANRLVLDTYDRLSVAVPGFRDLRPRIEHAQVVAPRDWPRFPGLGVIPSMQPAQALTDGGWVRARLGDERARGANAWCALAPELGRLAFGSDCPTQDPSPLRGMHVARTRNGQAAAPFMPKHRLDGAAALAGFTSGAAYAARQEDRRGRLAPGYGCDLTVLSVDPTTCSNKALLEARVLMTVVNGEIVYRAQ